MLARRQLMIATMAWAAAVGSASAEQYPMAETLPAIAIIVDDMGHRHSEGERALALPGTLTYSFLPHTPAAHALAERANALGKEVLLHLPMEAEDRSRRLGPGALLLRMTRAEVLEAILSGFASVPYAIGVNNHMGSLYTAEREPMRWVMQGLKSHGARIYVDSRTTAKTVAALAAADEQVAFLRRDVFLDNEPGVEYVRGQLFRLVERAHAQGYALAIGHPRRDTLAVLEEVLPRLQQHGVRLVRLSELLELQQRSAASWQLSSSRSPKAVKN